jgi:hypothetical protein
VIPLAEPIVDTQTLLEVVGYSLLAGIGLSIAFSFAILGATRFADLRRGGRPVGAGAYAALGTLGVLACAAAVVLGFVVMTSK